MRVFPTYEKPAARPCLSAILALTGLAFIILAPRTQAQQAPGAFEVAPGYTLRQWTVDDGLPVKSITDLYQDQRGFLWVATFSGLARFDGLSFDLFQADKFPGLPSNRIVDISTSPAGFMILLTESGDGAYFDGKHVVNLSRTFDLGQINSFGRTNGSPMWLFTDSGVVELDAGPRITALPISISRAHGSVESERSGILVGSEHGFYRYDANGDLEHLTEADGLPSRDVRSIVEEPNGDLILATAKGVVRLSGRMVIPIRAGPGELQPGESIHIIRMGSDILVSTNIGWRKVDGDVLTSSFERGTFPTVPLGIFPSGAAVDTDGNFWFASGGDVYRNDERILKSDGMVRTILADNKHGVWIGHGSHGLIRIVPTAVSVMDVASGLPGNNVYGLASDADGRTWAGLLDTGMFARIEDGKASMSVTMGTPWAVGTDPQGHIWLGGESLCRVDGGTCNSQANPPIASPVRAIGSDSQGRFWVGTQTGLWMQEASSGPWSPVTDDESGGPVWIRTIYEGLDGSIYVGTFGKGVAIYKKGKLSFWNQRNGFTSDNVRSFHQPEPGVLWIGTEDKGLVRATFQPGEDVINASLDIMDSRSGLPDNSIHSMLVDQEGRIWINSNNGIYSFRRNDADATWNSDVPSLNYELFDNRRGLANREGNGGIQSAGFVDTSGNVHFPTQGGIAIIHPDRIREINPPDIHIETVGTSKRTLDIENDQTVQLGSDEVDLRIGFAAPFYDNPEDLRFRYRLNGYADTWTMLGSDALLQITNMPPGSYALELESGLAGKWSDSPSRVILVRESSFQESIWFLVLLVVFGMTSGVLLIFGRTRAIKRQKEHLEAVVSERTATISAQAERLSTLDEMKTRFFTNVSHELRTPLTLIKAPLSLLLESRTDSLKDADRRQLQLVDRSVGKLQHLVNQILDLSALEAGKKSLSVSVSDLRQFVSGQVDAFRPAADIRNISLDLNTSNGPLLWTYDPEKLEWVLANLLGNALKFSPDGSAISVLLRLDGQDEVVIAVRDEGPGIDATELPYILDRYYQGTSGHSDVGSGIGLSIIREVVSMHEGRIEVESEIGEGSCFTITLPRLSPESDVAQESTATTQPVVAGLVADEEPASDNRTRSTTEADARNVILVAEDNIDLLAFIQDVLSELYKVVPVQDGQQALDECRRSVPDLVITDVMMPEMDGMELCTLLKSDLATSHIPVVMLTASADTQTMSSGLQTGADVYLTKPFETPKLIAYIDSLLENRKRLRVAYSGRFSIAGESETPDVPDSLDEQFVKRLYSLIHDQLSDPSFKVETLADQMYLSSRQFLRKVEALTGESPSLLLRRVRLENAASMIQSGAHSLSEIAHAVGFSSTSGFRKAFKQHFGVPPSEWTGH